MAILDTTRSNCGTAGTYGRIGTALAFLRLALTAWNDNRRTQKALNSLSDRELDDIGISRSEIEALIK